MFDLEMIRQIGYCHGIENYSRHFSGRLPGPSAATLLDYLPADALLFIEKAIRPSRSSGACIMATAPAGKPGQVRLPAASALDNRPLTSKSSRTRASGRSSSRRRRDHTVDQDFGAVIEQIIRPTAWSIRR